MQTTPHRVPTGDGWEISLHQTRDELRFDPSLPPVAIVPGYGMNSFIFSYHPRGTSLEGYLAAEGFEVWRFDMRGQGASRRLPGGPSEARFGLEDLALKDLPAAVDAALSRTLSRAGKISLIGASLGGTLTLAQAALRPDPRVASLVLMGAPLRWVEVHPLLRVAFAWPALVGAIRLRGTRRLAEVALPHLAARLPWLLGIYMNPSITDTSAVAELVKTVEDPSRHVNREIAHWIARRDLVVAGANLTEAARRIEVPVFCVLAKQDGIVPRATARFAYDHVASKTKAILEVGTEDLAMAHADMFASDVAHERVFAPLAAWLKARAAEK